jgi:hypothetical protein
MVHLKAVMVVNIFIVERESFCMRIKGDIAKIHTGHVGIFVQGRQVLKPVSNEKAPDVWGEITGSVKELREHSVLLSRLVCFLRNVA